MFAVDHESRRLAIAELHEFKAILIARLEDEGADRLALGFLRRLDRFIILI
jgi:hypothetical protein